MRKLYEVTMECTVFVEADDKEDAKQEALNILNDNIESIKFEVDEGISIEQKRFRNKCYEKYQLDWMMNHGYSLNDLLNFYRNSAIEKTIDCELDSDMNIAWQQLDDDFNEHGFNGECFCCYDEFMMYEYQNTSYMKYLLNKIEYETYLSLERK